MGKLSVWHGKTLTRAGNQRGCQHSPSYPRKSLQLQQPVSSHSTSDWFAWKPETDGLSNHPSRVLPHDTFNGLSTRWIPLAESWPPVCCAKLTFVLYQIWWMCVTSPLCALCSFFPLKYVLLLSREASIFCLCLFLDSVLSLPSWRPRPIPQLNSTILHTGFTSVFSLFFFFF